MKSNVAEMKRMMRTLERGAENGVRAAVTLTLSGIQSRTPRDTHFAASSLRVKVGSPFKGFPKRGKRTRRYVVRTPADLVSTAMGKKFRLGKDVIINALASYFLILTGGRRLGSHGRMIGSLQAPDPFIPPAIQQAAAAFRKLKLSTR